MNPSKNDLMAKGEDDEGVTCVVNPALSLATGFAIFLSF